MNAERTRQLALGVLALVLVALIYRAWNDTSVVPAATSNGKGPSGTAQARPEAIPTLSVHLDALDAERPKPDSVDRDLFRFKPKAAPPPAAPRPSQGAIVPSTPVGPPPPPPITLKFLGLMRQAGKPDMAVLSDGIGPPMFGYVGGPPVAGKYRILRIGAESIEISYLDGSGRTTIRLGGP
jgi:hypothetical protein